MNSPVGDGVGENGAPGKSQSRWARPIIQQEGQQRGLARMDWVNRAV